MEVIVNFVSKNKNTVVISNVTSHSFIDDWFFISRENGKRLIYFKKEEILSIDIIKE